MTTTETPLPPETPLPEMPPEIYGAIMAYVSSEVEHAHSPCPKKTHATFAALETTIRRALESARAPLAAPTPPAAPTKIVRREDTPEARAFWARAEASAREVETWPDWKRAGINVATERTTPPAATPTTTPVEVLEAAAAAQTSPVRAAALRDAANLLRSIEESADRLTAGHVAPGSSRCETCGYDEALHRAYSRMDGGGRELGAYLGGSWHPFRPAAPSSTEGPDQGGDHGK